MAAAQRPTLETGWSFKRTDEGNDSWAPVARVPTAVHMDLLDNKKTYGTTDPFIHTNELDVEWIGKHSWTYQTTFTTPNIPEGASVYLLFDGLDTFANVRLTDVPILKSNNMFLSHRVPITSMLYASGRNHLVIHFDSALLRGRDLVKEHPKHRFLAHNGKWVDWRCGRRSITGPVRRHILNPLEYNVDENLYGDASDGGISSPAYLR